MTSINGVRDVFFEKVQWRQSDYPGSMVTQFLMDESDATSPLIVLSKSVPGEVIEPHSHATSLLEYVIQGEVTVGAVVYRAGDMRLVESDVVDGPIIVGPEGCMQLTVFQRASDAMPQPVEGKS